jgi:SAM-dependent methyltransferase
VLPRTISILRYFGFELRPGHRVLDFGCGSGRHVYEFRDAGYEAFGVDLANYAQLREPKDKAWFAVSKDLEIYRFPFPDNFFDVVISTATLEHVRLYDATFREIRRVLAPGGISLHAFPSKWRPIEPHFKCPFGGAITWHWYYLFWSILGIKGADYHVGKSAKEQARMNWEFSRTAMNYLTKKEIEYFARQSFASIHFAEKEFVESTSSSSKISRLVFRLSKVFPPIIPIYRGLHTKVLVLSGYPKQSIEAFGSWKLPTATRPRVEVE